MSEYMVKFSVSYTFGDGEHLVTVKANNIMAAMRQALAQMAIETNDYGFQKLRAFSIEEDFELNAHGKAI